jgi:glyoxylate/hydroxypyruvate reductase A
MIHILYAGPQADWDMYKKCMECALDVHTLNVHISPDIPPDQVAYIIYSPDGPVQDFSIFPNLNVVFNLWAGVERVVNNPTLNVPLTRMVDPGLTEGMVEWCVGHVLRHHLGMDAHIVNPSHEWAPKAPPLARWRKVTVLGLGELGGAVARALAALNFQVSGWSARAKDIPGVTCYAGGDLASVLEDSEIVVLLLPDTPDTVNVLDAETLAYLAPGAAVINPGRGPLIDDDALLAALESGQVGHATLDVFRAEPLPRTHPFWQRPNVTVTPHIASTSRPETTSAVIAENLRRAEAGEPLLYLVDRARGY